MRRLASHVYGSLGLTLVTSAACAYRRPCSTASAGEGVPPRPLDDVVASSNVASSAASDEQTNSAHTAQPSGEEQQEARHNTMQQTMELAATARREINELWNDTSDEELRFMDGSDEGAMRALNEQRTARISEILARYKIDPTTPREEDVCRGLGDALDRLILLCVPLSTTHNTEQLERILHVAGRQGRQLSVRTVQHLFARTSTFAEALAVFYALRQCHFAMSMEAYHAMLYSLQRLEEEGWAQRFHDEYKASNEQTISEQALDFVLRGVGNQLLPENKPWLGRIMFAETDNAAVQRQSRESFDELGKLWIDRYKNGGGAS